MTIPVAVLFLLLKVAPVITVLPSDETTVQPNTTLFTCTSTGLPRPSIQWWRRTVGTNLTLLSNSTTNFFISESVSGERERTSHLSVVQTFPSDAGNYTCMVENVVGSTNDTATLTVQGKFIARTFKMKLLITCLHFRSHSKYSLPQ